ncbi:MAG: hypothetical protein VB096_07625 [Pseudoflavonifractor sp.]|nr:hypothetical protein [Pseudoflavonifractor sp.]
MFETQNAFFHGLRALFRNPFLLVQQEQKVLSLAYDLNLAESKVKYHDSSATHKQNLLDHAQAAIQEKLSALVQTAMERLPAERVYELLLPWDKEQFTLYHAAKELLGIDACEYFYTEDAMGYFEDADGAKLMKYAEIAKFAEKEWRPLNSPGTYEVLENYDLHTETPEYCQYREQLWPLAVQKVVEQFKRILLREDGITQVFQVMDTLDKAIREDPEPEPEPVDQRQLKDLVKEACLFCDPSEVYQAIQPMDPQSKVLFRYAETMLDEETVSDICKHVVNGYIRGGSGFLETPRSMTETKSRVAHILDPEARRQSARNEPTVVFSALQQAAAREEAVEMAL